MVEIAAKTPKKDVKSHETEKISSINKAGRTAADSTPSRTIGKKPTSASGARAQAPLKTPNRPKDVRPQTSTAKKPTAGIEARPNPTVVKKPMLTPVLRDMPDMSPTKPSSISPSKANEQAKSTGPAGNANQDFMSDLAYSVGKARACISAARGVIGDEVRPYKKPMM